MANNTTARQITPPKQAPRNFIQKKVTEAKQYFNKKKKQVLKKRTIKINDKGPLGAVNKRNKALRDTLK